MNAADFRRLALAESDAVELDHHGSPSFRVAGKIFATLPDTAHAHLMLEESEIREAVALDPLSCEEKWWGKKLSALRVDLRKIDRDALAALVHEAWARRAPRSKGDKSG